MPRVKYTLLLVSLFCMVVGQDTQLKEQQDIEELKLEFIKEFDISKNITKGLELYGQGMVLEDPQYKILGINVVTKSYFYLENYKKAFQYVKILDKLCDKEKDYYVRGVSYMYKYKAFSKLGFLDEAKYCKEQAIKCSEKLDGDSRHLLKMFISYLNQKDGSPVVHQLNAIKEAEQIKNRQELKDLLLARIKSVLGKSYINLKKMDSAYFYTKEAEELMSSFTGYEVVGVNVLSNYAKLFEYKNQTDSAIVYYNKALVLAEQKWPDKRLMREIHQNLAGVYAKIKNYPKSVIHQKKGHDLADELNTNLAQDVNIASQYIIEQKEKNSVFNKKIIYLFILILIILIGVVVFLILKTLRKQKTVANNLVNQKNKSKHKISESKVSKEKTTVDLYEKVIDHAKKNSTEFTFYFNQLYPGFTQNLKNNYPTLTKKEIKFCAMLRLNFNAKQIAEYQNVTTRAIEVRKNRLRKKIKVDSSVDLYQWMMNQ